METILDDTQLESLHASLQDLDAKNVWHPFTQAQTAPAPLPIVKAEGAYLYTADGDAYLDAISSWWVNLHGHCHPHIAAAIARQASTLEHVLFAGCTHPPAVELATRILELLPPSFTKVFYSDNGSTAIEVALKMAIQYRHNTAPSDKKATIVAFRHSYHGDTFGAMSASNRDGFTEPFWPYLFDVAFIDPPVGGDLSPSYSQLKRLIQEQEVAAFIFEPLVQGAGGMIMHDAEELARLVALCREHGVLTIADEVMTGFGRTGPLFAIEHLGEHIPDIICLSKGITGGFLPLSATICTETIYEAFLSEKTTRAFLHGHSYTANPLACAAGLASLDLLCDPSCAEQRAMIERKHRDFKKLWGDHPALTDCRIQGTILAMDYRTEGESTYFNQVREKLYQFFIKEKVLLRPLGNTVYALPPYCITEEELDHIYALLAQTLSGVL